jgi:hypothetical protein
MSKFDINIINAYLPFLLTDYRGNVVGLLYKYGYNTVSVKSNNKDISVVVLKAIGENADFSNDFDTLISSSIEMEHNYLNSKFNGGN